MNTKNFRLLGIAAAATFALAGCATTSPGYNSGYNGGYSAPPSNSSASCYDCGTVTRIEQTSGGSSAPNATGAVLGGLVGAVAGRAIAKNQTNSTGKQNTATVVGAVGGAVAGNAIQNNVQNRNGNGNGNYNVYVRMDDGRTTVLSQTDLGGIRQGSYVRVYNGRAWAR